MILILIFAEALGLYGLIVALILSRRRNLSAVNNDFQPADQSITVSEATVVEPYNVYVTDGVVLHSIDQVLILSALPSPKSGKSKSGKAKSGKAKSGKSKSSKRGKGTKMRMQQDGASQQKPARKRGHKNMFE